MEIGGIHIGTDAKPFVIAELSANHNQSLDRALAIVEAAAETGVSAIKLQTFTADTITLNHSSDEFFVRPSSHLWKGERLYDLFAKASTPWEWHPPIMKKARELGLLCFSSVFDATSIDFLEKLDVPAFKIASYECIDVPLLRRVAMTGKPVIISTGMATAGEIEDAVNEIRKVGRSEIALLKCTSTYPAAAEDSNLATIPHMRSLFGLEVGLSDHTLGIGVAVASVPLGSTMIEKHLTLSRADGGVDSAFSLEPPEMKSLVAEAYSAWRALGAVHYGPTAGEMDSTKSRRSLYFVQDMKKGQRITTETVRSIRPGLGLPPKYLSILVGKRINSDIRKGSPVMWDIIG